MPSFGFAPAAGAGAGAAPGGTTWARYWSLLAPQLGRYDNGLSVSALGTGPDAARYLILDGLRDDEADRDAWAGGWLYARTSPTSGIQLKILGQGYHGQFGAVAVANPPAEAIPIGTQVELSHPLPIKTYAGTKGVAALCNEGLEISQILARVTIGGDGTRSHALAGPPAILSFDQVRSLWDFREGGTTEPSERSPEGMRLVSDGADRTLVTDATYSSSETFELEVIVPGDRLVNDGTGWLYPTTPGLQADDWQAAPDPRWVVAFGMCKGLQELRKLNAIEMVHTSRDMRLDRNERGLMMQGLSEQRADIERRVPGWEAAAMKIILEQFPHPTIEREESGLVVGVNARRRSGRWP